MFGTDDLKGQIRVTSTTVECPVKDCTKVVPRQRRVFKKAPAFICEKHGIYISPSSFEYECESDNLLWAGADDVGLLAEIKRVKRESKRLARDNSEDAVTWNTFRFLERNRLLGDVLGSVSKSRILVPDLIYWTYSQKAQGPWPEIQTARVEFGEAKGRGSEPDLILLSDEVLLFIEAKLTATNSTVPRNPDAGHRYTLGGDVWWNRVFASDFETVAIGAKRYELARFWLIGTWIAQMLSLDFYLINLMPERGQDKEKPVFGEHIKETEGRRHVRVTWEKLFRMISAADLPTDAKTIIMNYSRTKTIGYDRQGRLRRAFEA